MALSAARQDRHPDARAHDGDPGARAHDGDPGTRAQPGDPDARARDGAPATRAPDGDPDEPARRDLVQYSSRIVWTGGGSTGTASYTGYDRAHDIVVPGKPVLRGSADPVYAGDAERHNPEDLFLAAVSACHMLTYLALCARHGVIVLSYEDQARGTLATFARGGGRFEELSLSPVVTITDAALEARAVRLHDTAHQLCFIANSCSVPIHHTVTVRIADAAEGR